VNYVPWMQVIRKGSEHIRLKISRDENRDLGRDTRIILKWITECFSDRAS